MQNKINSGSLDTLKPGQCLLVNCRPTTSGDKMYLEFAEAMETSPSTVVLADEDEVIEHQMLDADAVEPGKEATKVNVDTGEITESTMGI